MNVPPTALPSRLACDADTPPPRVLRVLYADDVRELREVIQLTLTRGGHRVDCVVNGAVALKQLEAEPTAYDLLITDHHMPYMNGLELVAAVRALPSYRGRILVFTSELSLHIAAAYRRLRVDQMIPKPVFPSELRRIIASLFAEESGQNRA